jgi:uncharacterized protein
MSVIPNIFLAAQNNDKDLMIEALKTTSVDLPGENEGYTALMIASNYGFSDMVELLLKSGANVNAQTTGGMTALALSISPKEEEAARIVSQLLAAGADVNLASGGGNTPLMEAAYQGNTTVLKVLLKAGADVNRKNQYAETALMTTLVGGDEPEIIRLLLEAGADKELKSVDDEQAADIAHRLSRTQSFTALCR